MTHDAPVIHVIDDDPSVQKGLSRLIASAGFRVEAYSSGEEYLNRGKLGGHGCLLVDVKMPGIDGMELHEILRKRGCVLPLIFLTGHGDIRMSVNAMKRGAFHFLTKPVDECDLLATLNQAIVASSRDQGEREVEMDIRNRLALLTPREVEVLRCVISGALNKQIARHLSIAEKTVKVHRARVMEKMEADSVAELVRICDCVNVHPTGIAP